MHHVHPILLRHLHAQPRPIRLPLLLRPRLGLAIVLLDFPPSPDLLFSSPLSYRS